MEHSTLETKFLCNGYKTGNVVLPVDNQLEEILNLLDRLPINIGVPLSKNMTKMYMDKFKSDAPSFIKNNFKLHDILYIKLKEVMLLIDKCSNEEEKIEKITKRTSLISPLKLPISYTKGHSMTGNTEKLQFYYGNEQENFANPNNNILFTQISLGNLVGSLSPVCYTHEIGHTQLESIYGSVNNFHNGEIIPILLEKICAYEMLNNETLLNKCELMRFRDLYNCLVKLKDKMLSKEEKIISSQYVVSTLKAQQLFNIYLNGNNQIRREMKSNIQSIFDGKCTVEDFLNKYDVTYESSKDTDIIKKHLKK